MFDKISDFFKKDGGPRRCIFCSSSPLTREHIYPQWSFGLFGVPETSFNPSTLAILLRMDGYGNEEMEHTQKISSNRETRYQDFTIKAVCKQCNEGWMSEIEQSVKRIFEKLLGGATIQAIGAEDAYQLSLWAIYKSILLAKTLQVKYEFDNTLLAILSQKIIPEGFIVEFVDLPDKHFNFSISTIEGLSPSVISRDEMNMAEDNSFLSVLHFGNYGFRVTFLRSSISVQRYQMIDQLLLLYPYHGKMPFVPGEASMKGEVKDPESQHASRLGRRIKLLDRYNFKSGCVKYVEQLEIINEV